MVRAPNLLYLEIENLVLLEIENQGFPSKIRSYSISENSLTEDPDTQMLIIESVF